MYDLVKRLLNSFFSGDCLHTNSAHELELAIADRQAQIEAMIHYPGGNAVVPEDHEKKVLTLMSRRNRHIQQLQKLRNQVGDE